MPMQILTADIGTGTQDILLFDSERTPENCLKLVVPSPTLRLSGEVRAATAARRPLLITGRLMGGGPVSWAVEDHHRAGLPILSTEEPARTFNDDLEKVQRELGVVLIDDPEAAALIRAGRHAHIEFRDFDYAAIRQAFIAFGVDLRPDALALAVFDHGAAPPDVSDRQFRMDYLADRLRRDERLSALAFRSQDVPADMTRLAAVAQTAAEASPVPAVVMDTAPAAVLGALEDPIVGRDPNPIVVNIGNFHTLAFQFRAGRLLRMFEHHTGELTSERLVRWLRALAGGSIRCDAVFDDNGHGALVIDDAPQPLSLVAVVGPRRSFLRGADLPLHFAVPHGDQMLAGCHGLLRACADIVPDWRDPIRNALAAPADRGLW